MSKRPLLRREDIDGRKTTPALPPKPAPPPAESGYVPPKSRIGRVTFAVHVYPVVRGEMKALAARRGISLQALMEEAMNKLYVHYEGRPLSGYNEKGEPIEPEVGE